jgi:hypothetical protein
MEEKSTQLLTSGMNGSPKQKAFLIGTPIGLKSNQQFSLISRKQTSAIRAI